MIHIIQDPKNPERLSLSVTVTLFLDKVLDSAVSKEVEETIRAQAKKDLKGNPKVKAAIAKAATEKLLKMLDITEEPAKANHQEILQKLDALQETLRTEPKEKSAKAEPEALKPTVEAPAVVTKAQDLALEMVQHISAEKPKVNPADFAARAVAPRTFSHDPNIID